MPTRSLIMVDVGTHIYLILECFLIYIYFIWKNLSIVCYFQSDTYEEAVLILIR